VAKKKFVDFDVDYAESLCSRDGRDCVYWQTAKGPRGHYVTVVVDSDTGSFVDNLTVDDGPYVSEQDADEAGLSAAMEWLVENQVKYTQADYRQHLKRLYNTPSLGAVRPPAPKKYPIYSHGGHGVDVQLTSKRDPSGVFWSDRHNSYVVVHDPKHGLWISPWGDRVGLYSINGIGEIRWPVWEQLRNEEERAAVDFFDLDSLAS
jgi:hypothetical protein